VAHDGTGTRGSSEAASNPQRVAAPFSELGNLVGVAR
jgi:hypothetical protein